jgi:hypothetical protein
MRIMITRQLYILYLIIITYNIVIIRSEIWNDDDAFEIVNGTLDTILLQMQYMQSMMDGSTSKNNLFIIKYLIWYFS